VICASAVTSRSTSSVVVPRPRLELPPVGRLERLADGREGDRADEVRRARLVPGRAGVPAHVTVVGHEPGRPAAAEVGRRRVEPVRPPPDADGRWDLDRLQVVSQSQ
jgi:hypothetical protein